MPTRGKSPYCSKAQARVAATLALDGRCTKCRVRASLRRWHTNSSGPCRWDTAPACKPRQHSAQRSYDLHSTHRKRGTAGWPSSAVGMNAWQWLQTCSRSRPWLSRGPMSRMLSPHAWGLPPASRRLARRRSWIAAHAPSRAWRSHKPAVQTPSTIAQRGWRAGLGRSPLCRAHPTTNARTRWRQLENGGPRSIRIPTRCSTSPTEAGWRDLAQGRLGGNDWCVIGQRGGDGVVCRLERRGVCVGEARNRSLGVVWCRFVTNQDCQ